MEPPVPNEQDQERLASFLNQNEEETNASNNSATPIVSNTTRPTSVNTSTVSTEATSNTDSHAPTALYDPYNPVAIRQSVRGSLLDDEESTVCTVTSNATATQHDEEDIGTQKHSIPGTANFLEMEQEPPRTPPSAVMVGRRRTAVSRPPPEPEAPIQTSSGLLLTHRRTPQGGGSVSSSSRNRTTANQRDETHNYYDDDDNQKQRRRSPSSALFAGPLANERFEVEDAHSAQYYRQEQESFLMHRQLSPLQQARRWLRYARAWVILCAIVLVLGMSIVLKHARHENSIEDGDVQVKNGNENYFVQDGGQQSDETNNIVRVVALDQVPEYSIPDKVVLLPLDTTTLSNQKNQQPNYHPNTGYNQQQQEQQQHSHHHGRMLSDLRDDFASWMQRHGKVYNSIEEQEKRYHIWVENHHRTRRKNEEHGPCKLTAQPVFGSNHLQDLTQEEFAQQYLNSAPKPRHDAKENKTKRRQDKRATKKEPGIMGSVETKRHPEVHRRIQELWGKDGTTSSTNAFKGHARQSNWKNCDWYDASCYLKYIMENYFYGLGRTMEPAYDADSYPNAVDWRDVGAVTEVHSQGNCGACWAITAVETIESATFLASGELRDLSEAEVIVCAEDCEMCSGGWPQNAFDYVMELGGIPLESDMSYDGDYLLALTEALEGERNDVDVESYRQEVCPAGRGSQSGDNDDTSGTQLARYGMIEGYGYATDKCVCYTDGSGCDCDSQNEGLAVRNLATYGPAVVCVDASTWQDYTGGIITADSGCSSGFMDVNHCIQAVGYAFATAEGATDGGDDEEKSGSGSGSKDESSDRVGYWIVRNQWSSYWGMNGYAYVSMGDNTCGILNDMLQVYT